MDLVEIARHLEISQKDVEDDLRHLIKSLYLISNRISDSR
jgi:hypothetical protein